MRWMKLVLFSLLITGLLSAAASAQSGAALADATPPAHASGPQTIPGSAARVDFSALASHGQYGSASFSDPIANEFAVQVDGWFTQDSLQSGIPHVSTNSAGFNIGYRRHVASWFSLEANYDYGRIANKYTNAGASFAVQSQIHGISGNLVVGPRNATGLRPFVLVGGGALVFNPTNNAGGAVPGNQRQTRGTFDFGAGLDLAFWSRLSLRLEYRGFLYQVPDFGLATLHTNKHTISSVPSVGLVFTF